MNKRKPLTLFIFFLIISCTPAFAVELNENNASETIKPVISNNTTSKTLQNNMIRSTPYKTTIYVSENGDDSNSGLSPESSKRTITSAMQAADDGDTIKVASGVYNVGVYNNAGIYKIPLGHIIKPIVIDKNLTLIGENRDNTIIDANSKSSVITVQKGCNVTVEGFTLKKGHPWFYGGGIDNRGILTLKNCNIQENTAVNGGGIYNTGTLNAIDCNFIDNQASYGGGIYNDKGSITLNNCNIQENKAWNGGGLYNLGIYHVTYSKINNNNASDGGGIYNNANFYCDEKTEIKDNQPNNIRGNQPRSKDLIFVSPTGSDYDSGLSSEHSKRTISSAIQMAGPGDTIKVASGVYNETIVIDKNLTLIGENRDNTIIDANSKSSVITIQEDFNVSIKGFTLQNGHPWKYGGGIDNRGILTLKNCNIQENKADEGSGVYNAGTCNITECTIQNSKAEDGGGVYNKGIIILSKCKIQENRAGYEEGRGGGFYNTQIATITDCNITDNKAGNGGGIYSKEGSVTLTNSILNKNRVYICGGGVYNAGTFNVTNCNITDSKAEDASGVYNEGNFTLTNCNIQDNSAIVHGGGIYNYYGTFNANNCKIASNNASDGGGIYNYYGTFTVLQNVIINNNANGSSGGGVYNKGREMYWDRTTEIKDNKPRDIDGDTINYIYKKNI